MKIKVVYLARLREVLGRQEEVLTLAPAQVAVADVLAVLRERSAPWSLELAAGRAVRAAVNHEMADPETAVRDGDEVAFFPPVTGG